MAASSLLRSATRCLRRSSIPRALDRRLVQKPRRLYSSAAAAGPQGLHPCKHSTAQPEMEQQIPLVGVKNKAQGSDYYPLSMEVTNLSRTVQEMKQKVDILCKLHSETRRQERRHELWRPICFLAILAVIIPAKT